ncbi:U3 snoRNP protein, partial [Friedmanniomyces endolithicus]
EETQILEGPEKSDPSLNSPVSAMYVSLDGQLIASASWDGTVRLWDVATGEETQKPIVTNAQWITAVDLAPDREILAFGSMHGNFGLSDLHLGTTRLRDADTGEEIDEVSDAMRSRKGRAIHVIKISPDSKTILLASDPMMRLWDVATEKVTKRFPLSSTGNIEKGILMEYLTAVAFSPD